MNLVESIIKLRDIINTNQKTIFVEDKGHLDHPEDLIFLKGSDGAKAALRAIVDTVKHPTKVTIKWDGYPALIFGRDINNRFSIVDKHMFNKKDGTGREIYSPEDFAKYDLDRGVDRSNLHKLIEKIWKSLEQSCSTQGYYWGDLLFSEPLVAKDNLYIFKANPNGIKYTVQVDSDLGKFLTNKIAGIAVHQYLSPTAYTTDDASSLDGTIGSLTSSKTIAIVPSKMPITPKLKLLTTYMSKAEHAVNKYGDLADDLMNNAPQARNTFNQLFTTFINKKIVAGNLENLVPEFMEYVKGRPMTDKMRQKIDNYLLEKINGVKGAFEIWSAVYMLKMTVVKQLDKAAVSSPIQGYLSDGTQTQEGFVSHGLKFVNRMWFSRQNLQGRTA